MKIYHIAAALIRKGDEILVVHQRALDGNEWWSTPGGVIEDGETLIDALVREVREETGLEVLDPGRLVYVTQWENIPEKHQAIAFVFEVKAWRGELQPDDPDGLVFQACFLPIDQVIVNLRQIKWGILTEPAIAYLRGEAVAGTVWIYRWQSNENISLVGRYPSIFSPHEGGQYARRITSTEGRCPRTARAHLGRCRAGRMARQVPGSQRLARDVNDETRHAVERGTPRRRQTGERSQKRA